MLSIENLSVDYYRRGQIISAVRNLSLSINPGEAVGLVGESGSGKSTVALAILRLIRPQEGHISSGKINFQGEDLLALPYERMRAVRGKRISMIFQDPFTALNPVMRIREQMKEIGVRDEGRVTSPIHERPSSLVSHRSSIDDVLERVQLDPVRILNAYPHQLSGGQRQRVMIAMALLGNPELILADEPTTALDTLVQKDILDLLFRLQKQLNIGMLFISHNLSLVASHTQRMAIMKAGAIVELGRTLDIVSHPAHPYTKQLWEAIPRFSER